MGNRFSSPMAAITNLALLVMAAPEPQYIIAAKCDMAPSRLSEYCNARRRIAPHHIVALCNYFQVPSSKVLGAPDLDSYAEILETNQAL